MSRPSCIPSTLPGILAFALAGIASVAHAQPSVRIVDGSFDPRRLSGDGRTVLGIETQNNNVAIWTASGGVQSLGFQGNAEGINFDGSVVVGTSFDESGAHAWRWTSATGRVNLSGPSDPQPAIAATAVSDDGNTIYGEGAGRAIFKWTPGAGVVVVVPATPLSGARTCSSDASVIGGWSVTSDPDTQATVWTSGGAATVLFHAPLGGSSEVQFLSSDGSVVVGSDGRVRGASSAFRADSRGSLAIPQMFFPAGMSADGNVILGAADSSERAVVWDASHGTRTLRSILMDAGVDLTGVTFNDPRGLSRDGLTVVGTAGDSWPPRMFVATLPAAPASCDADFNHSGAITVQDIFDFLAAYFAGCP